MRHRRNRTPAEPGSHIVGSPARGRAGGTRGGEVLKAYPSKESASTARVTAEPAIRCAERSAPAAPSAQPFKPIAHVNLTDQVYDAIKHRILSNQLEVGSRLRDEALALQLGVSRTPVREAIQRLSRERLVEIIPRSGTRVRTFTERDIAEIFELRIALEALAARKAATRLDGARLRWLREMHEQAEAALKKGDSHPALVFDSEMHLTILEASGNRRLQEVMSTITDFVVLFRNIGAGTPFHRGFTYRHRDIVRALECREPDGAARFLTAHIEVAKRELLRDFRQRKLLDSIESAEQTPEPRDRKTQARHRRVRRSGTRVNTERPKA